MLELIGGHSCLWDCGGVLYPWDIVAQAVGMPCYVVAHVVPGEAIGARPLNKADCGQASWQRVTIVWQMIHGV